MKAKILICITLAIFMWGSIIGNASEPASRGYITGASISDQFNFVAQESYRWQTFRMVPESWLEQLRMQTLDSFSNLQRQLVNMQLEMNAKDSEIVAMSNDLEAARADYKDAVDARDSINLLGMHFRKGFFVSIVIFLVIVMGTLIAGLVLFLQRANLKVREANDKMDEAITKFEEFRQETRRRQETMVIQHHKEIQRLKGERL